MYLELEKKGEFFEEVYYCFLFLKKIISIKVNWVLSWKKNVFILNSIC